jgi:membrane-associated protein
MQLIQWVIDLVLHMDKYLPQLVNQYGMWTYAILFVVIFIETGIVIFPFLPGDSLLFAAGAVMAATNTSPLLLYVVCASAAVLGDTVNYWIGHFIGPRAFTMNSRWLKKEYLDRTHAFFEKHGGKTILLARFVPIIRTFAPFVAGVGQMDYGYFLRYNVAGGMLWTGLFIGAGYFFGNLDFVKNNFSFVIIAIILISLFPAVYEYIKERSKSKSPELS